MPKSNKSDEYLKKESGHSAVPKNPAKDPGASALTPEDVKHPEGQDKRSRSDDNMVKRAEAALTTTGEEERPKKGNRDGGNTR